MDNGNTVKLSFDDEKGYLNITGADNMLDIGGLCVYSDDRIIICDNESGYNYSFGYLLHGDRIELNYNGGVISLNKEN